MELGVTDGTSIVLTAGSAAAAGEAGCAGLATHLDVQATQPEFAGTTQTVSIVVRAAVGAPNGTTQHNVLFVNGVVTGHLEAEGVLGVRVMRRVGLNNGWVATGGNL